MERFYSLDGFRIIAAFFVVSLHCSNLFYSSKEFSGVMVCIYRVAVPFFFMVSGFFYKRERTVKQIKKCLSYILLSFFVYMLVALFIHHFSMDSFIKELSILGDYRFWIFNCVPFCIVSWFLMSYVYILILSYLCKRKVVLYVIGMLSFLFSLIMGVYSNVFGLDVNSTLVNCSFVSTFCWFVWGFYIGQCYDLHKDRIAHFSRKVDVFCLVLFLLGIMLSVGEHYFIGVYTGSPVNGTTYVGTLIATSSIFLLLLKNRNWFRSFSFGELSVFVYLSHVAVHYILAYMFWPSRINLPYYPIFNLPFESIYIVNNVVVFVISCCLYFVYKKLSNIIVYRR